jgi:hypothetical protein
VNIYSPEQHPPTAPIAMADTSVTPASISPSISISAAMTAKNASTGFSRKFRDPAVAAD